MDSKEVMMMKKYNTPVIEALALETVDVIATSGHDAALKALQETYKVEIADGATVGEHNVADLLDTSWSW